MPMQRSPLPAEPTAAILPPLTPLADGTKITLSPFAARPNFFTTGYNIHLRRTQSFATIEPPLQYQALPWNFGPTVVQLPLSNSYPIPKLDESYSLVVAYRRERTGHDADRLLDRAPRPELETLPP